MQKNEVYQRIEQLKKKILEANKAYFLDNVEIIPEEVRDSLKRELKELEEKNPEFITPDSPTQRVWMPLEWALPKIKHSKKKESLSDVFSLQEIQDWLVRVGKDLPWVWEDFEKAWNLWYVCELKIDWLNLTLIYENWELKNAVTRGDGFIGEDVTNNIKTIFEIPLSINVIPDSIGNLNPISHSGLIPWCPVWVSDMDSNVVSNWISMITSESKTETQTWRKNYDDIKPLLPPLQRGAWKEFNLQSGTENHQLPATSYQLNLEISWEVFMTKKAFEEVQKKEWDIFKNSRNCASWTLRQLDPKIVESRRLSFFAYEISDELLESQYSKLQILASLWFPVENHSKLCNSFDEIKSFIEEWAAKRNDLPYEIDWIVIKLNDITLQQRLGSTAKSPRWAVAYKFPAKLAQSQILDVIFQVWRTWVITPVAVLHPVLLEWSTISRATLHNFDEIERLDVQIWDTVIIEKAWDVIPKVSSVLKDMRKIDSKKIEIPKLCPECWTNIIKNEWEVAIRCPNSNCWSQHLNKLIHFCSRNALNIDWFWDKLIELLIENKMIDDFWDIFNLQFWDFYNLPLIQEKKANNLIESIENAKHPFLSKFLFGLWIPLVWAETADMIAWFISKNIKTHELSLSKKTEQVSLFDFWDDSANKGNEWIKVINLSDLIEFIKLNKDNVDAIEWIWIKVLESFYEYFSEDKNIKILLKLEKAWVAPQAEKVSKLEQIFKWKTFVLTWSLPSLSRDTAKAMIKDRWWEVNSSVSKNTDFVLAGSEAWEKLETAQRLWIKVISEEEFVGMIGW